MSTPRTRWAIAGTGRMAAVFAADLALVPDAELVAVGSRRLEGARAFAAEHGTDATRAHGTYDDLVADDDVDVIYVATPHPQHTELALAAIAAGRAVLVEKAFTATLADTERVVAAAREAGVFCMEAMWTRFQPAVVRARELIAAGAIGEVRLVQADLGAHRPFDPDDRLFAPELGGGALLDLGVYVVSIAQHVLGDPQTVTATGTRYPNGVDASGSLLLSWADGRSASLACSLEGQSAGRATIVGTGGSIELTPRFHHPRSLVVRRHDCEPETIEAPPTGTGYTHEIDEVHRCLAAGATESAVMPLADTVAVQAVLEDALRQVTRR